MASSVGLLAIPITLFIVIISLYPDLTTIDDFKVYKLKSYHSICDTMRKDSTIIKNNPNTLESISLNKTTLALVFGGSDTLVASINRNNATNKTVWTSNNNTVAIVKNGIVTANNKKKKGIAIITAKVDGETASCEVTVDIIKHKKNIEHILLIDRTASTSLKSENFKQLKDNLIHNLNSVDKKIIDSLKHTQKDTTKTLLRGLLYVTLINSYKKSYEYDTLHVFFYNGHLYKNETCEELNTLELNPFFCENFGKKDTISKKINFEKGILLKDSAFLRTNFKAVFDTISNFVKKDKNKEYCITIFSDFYHDDTVKLGKISPKDVAFFRNSVGNPKLNLIVLWKEDYPDKQRKREQIDLINLIKENFVGICKTDFIFTNNYNDNRYWKVDTVFLEFKEMLDFDYNSDYYKEEKKISLYAPISDYLKYSEATCKIIMKNPSKQFRWRIKQLEPDRNNIYFWKFKKDCKGSFDKGYNRYFINQWYEEACDSLYLSIKLEHDTKLDDLRFVYSYKGDDGKDHFHEYGFEIKNVIFSNTYKQHLTMILNAFMVLLCATLISGGWLFYLHFFASPPVPAPPPPPAPNKWLEFAGILLLIGFIVLIFLFLIL